MRGEVDASRKIASFIEGAAKESPPSAASSGMASVTAPMAATAGTPLLQPGQTRSEDNEDNELVSASTYTLGEEGVGAGTKRRYQACCERMCGCVAEPSAGSCRAVLGVAARSGWLSSASTALVLVNIVLMCLPYYKMSDLYAMRLNQLTSVCD